MTESPKHPPIQLPLLDYSEYYADAYPVRHRHRTRFSPNPSLSEGYHRLCDEIRKLDSRLDELMQRDGGNLRLLCEACASNIHWSTKLEGNPLTLEQVKHITELFAEGTEQEIGDGPSQEVMNHLHQLFGEDHHGLPWTSEHIRGMHRMLMFGVDTDAVPGKVRTEPVDIVGADGFVYFIACPPADIGDQLDLLLDWLNSSLFDPICTAVVFYHEFESIHPFRDGNGRTGRSLFQELIRNLGLHNIDLCRFEQHLLQDPDLYYTLLSYVDGTGDYFPFICFTAEAIYRSYMEALDDFKKNHLSFPIAHL